MAWRKLGRVYEPRDFAPWARSHAANPVADPQDDRVCRVYFSTRDAENRSSIAWLEIDLSAPTKVQRLCSAPALSPGRTGAFDDSGVSMGCIVRHGGDRYLYYLGWNLGVTVPFRNTIGLAISRGDGPFERVSEAPVVDRGHHDPFCLSYPWILKEGASWRMWYGSNTNWGADMKEMAHIIKYAESDDGIGWRREGRVAVSFASPDEYAISKPCVLKADAGYRMWYTFRGARYRLGYAESADGLTWRRLDERVGIAASAQGWDAEELSYPCVFEQAGNTYMLFNGNGYGRTGFGIAIWE